MKLENSDRRIRHYELLLEKNDLGDIPEFQLPEGYRFSFYRPGDMNAWMEIEQSAMELEDYEAGLKAWKRFFEGKDEILINRMVFIEDCTGKKVATATAFDDITGRDLSGAGWLLWVAVHRNWQGRGLSKPLISFALRLMHKLGYRHTKIPTQTTTWVACRIYLDFGFRPIPANALHSRDGWRIIRTLTDHPALEMFDRISIRDIFYPDVTENTISWHL